APAVAAAEALLEPGQVLRHGARRKAERQPAVGDLRGQLHGRLVAGSENDRDIGIHVQDRFQRLADAQRAFAAVWKADLPPLVHDRALPAKNLAHDRDVILEPPIGPAPGLAIPALDDLRAGDAEA